MLLYIIHQHGLRQLYTVDICDIISGGGFILKERKMHIITLMAEQVRDREDLLNHEAVIMHSLLNSGYHLRKTNAALSIVQKLAYDTMRDLLMKQDKALLVSSLRTIRKERLPRPCRHGIPVQERGINV